MKPQSILILLSSFFATLLQAQKADTSYFMNLNPTSGNLDTIEMTITELDNHCQVLSKTELSHRLNGQVVKDWVYDSKIVFTYDQNDSLIGTFHYDYLDKMDANSTNPTWEFILDRDNQGRIIRRSTFSLQGSRKEISKIEYQFTGKHLTQKSYFNGSGSLLRKTEDVSFTFQQDQKIERNRIVYDSTGMKVWETRQEYKWAGQLLDSVLYYSPNSQTQKLELKAMNLYDYLPDSSQIFEYAVNVDAHFSIVDTSSITEMRYHNGSLLYERISSKNQGGWKIDETQNHYSQQRLDSSVSQIDENFGGVTQKRLIRNHYTYDFDQLVKTERIGFLNGQLSSHSQTEFSVCMIVQSTTDASKATSGIRVYPNPFENDLNVSVQSATSFKLLDFTGKEVLSGHLGPENTHLSIDDIPSGVYFLQLMELGEAIRLIRQ
ncbi:T9SS type A sorting domain-containing protein [bacterium SCSIO 12741]|nr:T9SS type A sorting domain-containing protein [bacterium SCSIO 12741]